MSTVNPVFSLTAVIAAVLCVIIMGIAGGIGKVVGWCRLVDEWMDKLLEECL